MARSNSSGLTIFHLVVRGCEGLRDVSQCSSSHNEGLLQVYKPRTLSPTSDNVVRGCGR